MPIPALLATLLYPGLLFGLALALGVWALLRGGLPRRAGVGVASLASALLALLALVALPWPLHPLAGEPWVGSPLLVVVALEAAFLLPLLPELTSDTGARLRAASREAQMGAAGRTVLYFALAAALAFEGGWSLAAAPGHLLLAVAAALGLPLAIGWGVFGPERSISPDAEPAPDVAHVPRVAAALAAVAHTWVPAPSLAPSLALALLVAATAVLALALRWAEGRFPRLPLPVALRLCWFVALPVALLGLVASALAV